MRLTSNNVQQTIPDIRKIKDNIHLWLEECDRVDIHRISYGSGLEQCYQHLCLAEDALCDMMGDPDCEVQDANQD